MSIEEIIKALEIEFLCENCPHNWRDCDERGCYYIEAAETIKDLKARAEKAEAERDAAIKDLYDACKYTPCNTGICVNKNCKGNVIPCDFKWRGVQEEEK